jgi:hypothetical protein
MPKCRENWRNKRRRAARNARRGGMRPLSEFEQSFYSSLRAIEAIRKTYRGFPMVDPFIANEMPSLSFNGEKMGEIKELSVMPLPANPDAVLKDFS